ncbi:transcription factor bHLH117 [Pyrus ussuriensis x Pyrus communis]|uniref:Transcription factor bHLH117 n=1 Tax=Pyrus ussuriensis x Pyrus communis TaxID=2448454 RepID=A0A5N5G5E1_9ROSA|nr:transcription factor bHLH117 [Pyrus ussuriensis x Pyrus communis]
MDETERELRRAILSLSGRADGGGEKDTACVTTGWDEEEATFNAIMSSGITFQPFLPITVSASAAHHHQNPMLPSSPSLKPLPYSNFAQDTLTNVSPATAAASDYSQIPRLAKHEPISSYQDYFPNPTFYDYPPDLNLLPNTHFSPPPPRHLQHHDCEPNDYSSIFQHLPDLLPLDPSNYFPCSSSSSSSYKRPRFVDSHHFCYPSASFAAAVAAQHFHPYPPLPHFNNTTPFAPLNNNYGFRPSSSSQSSSHANAPIPPPPPAPQVKTKRRITTPSPSLPGSALARQRRQRLSDKTRCLQKLLPWDKKMDSATTYGEAYKYIQFLQAQLSALQTMPVLTPPTTSIATSSGSVGGELERLSRNQLLQVLLNSPSAQNVMYSRGCCVFSVEQLDQISRRFSRKMGSSTASKSSPPSS